MTKAMRRMGFGVTVHMVTIIIGRGGYEEEGSECTSRHYAKGD